MIKKLVVAGVIVVACLVVAKKTKVASYACTLVTQGREQVLSQIPRSVVIANTRSEIKKLDRDYNALLGPIAEKKASIKRLDREITTGQANLAEQREALLALTKSVEAKETQISIQGVNYKLPRAEVELKRGFANFKKLETNLAAKERLLDAEQQYVAACLDQLEKLVTQKREFEVRLAELEAQESLMNARRVTMPMKSDDGRVADIKSALDQIEQSQMIETERRQLEAQFGTTIADAPANVQAGTVDVNEIRDHLTGKVNVNSKAVPNQK